MDGGVKGGIGKGSIYAMCLCKAHVSKLLHKKAQHRVGAHLAGALDYF